MTKKKPMVAKCFSLLFRIGMLIVGNILFFFALSLWLAKTFGFGKWMLLLGVLLGVFMGFYCIFREIKNLEKLESGDV